VKRLYVLVEGPTEEQFVKHVLEPHLRATRLTVPIIVATSRARSGAKKKGGGDWNKWKADLQRLSVEHTGDQVCFTTLFDLYGLPRNFPRLNELEAVADTNERARLLEGAMAADVPDARLIPYLQRHEFEALVLASLDKLEELLDAEDRSGLPTLHALLAQLSPEEVNDGVTTAPSKRLAKYVPAYQKTLHGPLAVEAKGIAAVRRLCPRFDAWLAKLEQ
jgi:hypothetical protein